jgi:hypothetical protein
MLIPEDHRLAGFLNERIERLDIDRYQPSDLLQLAEKYSGYFSNVRYIHICFANNSNEFQSYANIIPKI